MALNSIDAMRELVGRRLSQRDIGIIPQEMAAQQSQLEGALYIRCLQVGAQLIIDLNCIPSKFHLMAGIPPLKNTTGCVRDVFRNHQSRCVLVVGQGGSGKSTIISRALKQVSSEMSRRGRKTPLTTVSLDGAQIDNEAQAFQEICAQLTLSVSVRSSSCPLMKELDYSTCYGALK